MPWKALMRALCLALLLVGCSQTASTSPPVSPAPVADPPAQQAVEPSDDAEVDAPGEGAEAPADAPVPVDAEPPAPVTPATPAAPALLKAAGSACLQSAECASGTCEGQGCDASSPGTCAPETRACSRDRRPFCGCDGETFFSSSTCVGRRYASMGPC